MHQIDDDDPNKHIQYLVSSFNEMCVCFVYTGPLFFSIEW